MKTIYYCSSPRNEKILKTVTVLAAFTMIFVATKIPKTPQQLEQEKRELWPENAYDTQFKQKMNQERK